MPRGTAFDLELLATLKEAEVKKESETTTTSLADPDVEKHRFRLCLVVLQASAATVVSLEDETTVFAVIPLEAKVTVVVPLPMQGYVSEAAENELKFKTLNTAKFTGCFLGAIE